MLRTTELRRSVVLLALGAEESGLLGSWYFLKDATIPAARLAAAINHDGGLTGARHDDVFAWGPAFSTVEDDVAWAAAETGITYRNPPSDGTLRSLGWPALPVGPLPVSHLWRPRPCTSCRATAWDDDPERGRTAWESYLGSIHHRQADNFDPTASYGLPRRTHGAVSPAGLAVGQRRRNASDPR